MTVAWVVGSGGLLGSALCRALRRGETALFSPAGYFSWTSEIELVPQVAKAVQDFAARVVGANRWEIYWAAGVGAMSSAETALAAETRILSALLRLIESTPLLMAMPGALSFASSAGAIYAGSSDYIVTENTVPVPTTAYAREKLVQEEIVRSFVRTNGRVSALIARFSTLYGPGQSLEKQQGLLTHIARCTLKNIPVRIYVPFDSIRDYITSDDAAARMISALRGTIGIQRLQVKIIASEQPVTIAKIIATFGSVARRHVRVITSASKLSDIYPRRVCFQSTSVPVDRSSPRTSLLIGIAQVMASERATLMRSWHTSAK
jgi:UDP-glucose 4-epimerase